MPAVKYAKPPVVERAAAVFVHMDEDIYESKFQTWRQLVEKDLPVYEPLNEWLINIEQREGKATTDPLKTELRITPRFSKKKMAEGFEWGIRCPREALIVNMGSKPGSPSHYIDLRSSFALWFSRWTSHFEVQRLRRVNLHYVNVLNVQTVSRFMAPGPQSVPQHPGFIQLDRIIKVFVPLPIQKGALIPPLSCQATVMLEGREDSALQIILAGIPNYPPQPTLRLDFITETAVAEGSSLDEILKTLDWCHDHVIECFEAVFTDAAKESFEPMHS